MLGMRLLKAQTCFKSLNQDAQTMIWIFDLKSQPLGQLSIKSDFYSG